MRAKMRNTFEIVSVDEEGYRWRLVADGYELAESARTYRSRKRVRKAIAALRRADVVDRTSDEPCGIALPDTHFALVKDVEPLIVGAPPRRRKHKRHKRDDEAALEAAAADLEAQALEEAAIAEELGSAARSEAVVAEAQRRGAAAKARKAVVFGDPGAAVEARVEAAIADELEEDATVKEAASEALEADAKAKAKQAGKTRGQARTRRRSGKPAS